MAMPRDLFVEMGGFDAANTPISHSDVDLCLRLGERGYRCVYTPHATLRHIGHLSIGETERQAKARSGPPAKNKAFMFMLRRWSEKIADDPYFPPALRDLEYRDSPSFFQLFPGEPFPSGKGRDILIVSHDMSWSGAPVSFYGPRER
jgi:hypothetical protein